jgi:hypothetical protein
MNGLLFKSPGQFGSPRKLHPAKSIAGTLIIGARSQQKKLP